MESNTAAIDPDHSYVRDRWQSYGLHFKKDHELTFGQPGLALGSMLYSTGNSYMADHGFDH